MSVFKLTQFFKNGRQGFTESWYYTSSTATFKDMFKVASNLAKSRRGLLGGGVQLQGTRIEDVTPLSTPFDGKLPPGPNPSEIVYELDGGYSLASKPITVCQAPEDTALVDLYAGGSLYRKSLELHAIPQDAYTAWGLSQNQQILTAVFQNQITLFLQDLNIPTGNAVLAGGSPWALRGRTNRGAVGFGDTIEGISTVSATDLHVDVNVGGDPEWNIGDTIHLSGLKGCWAKKLNGDATVTAVNVVGGDVVLTINKTLCCPADIDYDMTGRYWHVEYNYFSIESSTIARYSWRKVGRPTFRTRGRARKRVGCCR